jgi:hypothetical protein
LQYQANNHILLWADFLSGIKMLETLANLLADISGQNIFISCAPEILDFTDKTISAELHFFLQGGRDFSLVLTDENLPMVISMLKLSILDKGMKVITWNWKSLASYILAKTGKIYSVDAAIIDLKIIESYAGRKLKAPKNLLEAMNRLKDLITKGIWKEIEPIYKKLHMPLSTVVIPHLETSGIIDPMAGGKVYAHYEIDGQENGRLRCFQAFKMGFVPHAMTPETRKSLKPRDLEELFMLFDFKGMEVFMLAWMSQDPLLLELCKQPDIYQALLEIILKEKSEEKNNRNLAKKIFLPVIYGQSAFMLSRNCGLTLQEAELAIHRINTLFPVALTFIESSQKQLQEHGYAKDIFGKRRSFEAGKEYSVRNFAVQSPASVVCLEKLTHLYFALKDKTDLAYTVHDGYVVYATKENWKSIFKIGYDILSSESEFCPGLKLKVAVKAGRNLDNLKPLARKGDL